MPTKHEPEEKKDVESPTPESVPELTVQEKADLYPQLIDQLTTATKALNAVPFNPFVKLQNSEVVALTSRYTKAWRSAHAVDIMLAQTEYGCSADEACFFAELKSDAIAIIDRETIGTVGDSIAGLVRGIGTAQREISLGLIKSEYDALKPELRNEVGKRVRDVTNKTYESATAAKLLSILYEHLNVREKDWMR